MSDRTLGLVLLATALLCGGLWMSLLLGAGPLALDEHGSYWVAGADNLAAIWTRSQSCTALPPLSAVVQRGFLALFGKSELAFRAASAAPYLAAILVTFLFARRLLGDLGGGVAALILASSPDVVDEVRLARCYGLVVLLAAVACWCAVRWKQNGTWRDAIAWSAANAALLWTHYLTLPVVLAQMASLPVFRWEGILSERLAIRQKVIAVLLVGMAALPLLPAVIRNWEWRVFLDYRDQAAGFWQIVGPFWWCGIPVGFVIARVIGRRGRADDSGERASSSGALLMLWWLLPMLTIAVAAATFLPTLSNARYRVAFAVPGAGLAAWLLVVPQRRGLSILATVVALTLGWGLSEQRPWTLKRLGDLQNAEWREIAATVEAAIRPGEPIFVQSGLAESNLLIVFFENRPLSEYAACRLGKFYLPRDNPRYGLPSHWGIAAETAEYYRGLLESIPFEQAPGLWVAAATDTDINRGSLAGFEQLLAAAGYTPDRRHEWKYSVLRHYSPPTDAQP